MTGAARERDMHPTRVTKEESEGGGREKESDKDREATRERDNHPTRVTKEE